MREREQREKAEREQRERAERQSREREQREQILSSSPFGSTLKRFGPAPLESHQPPPSTPPGSASETMADEHETALVEVNEEDCSDDEWGHWTAKGPRLLSTQELPAAKASKSTPPGSASETMADEHETGFKPRSTKRSQAKGLTLFVGQSRSKELWVDISWARNQGLDRVDGPINPQRAAWSDRFEFQILDFRQERWLKVTRVDTNKGWGQQLRVRMTSSMIEAEGSNASRTPKSSSTPPPSKLLASTGAKPKSVPTPGSASGSKGQWAQRQTEDSTMLKRRLGGPVDTNKGWGQQLRVRMTSSMIEAEGSNASRTPKSSSTPPPSKLLASTGAKPKSVPTPGSASGSKGQWAQRQTEDYDRKKLAEEQRSAAVAADKTRADSHRLWLDKKYEKRTQKRLAKQSAKEGFS